MIPKSNQISQTSEIIDQIESSQKERNEDFRIYSAIDIQFILRGIMQSKTLVTLYSGQGNSFILTSILAIYPENKGLVMDYGIEENLNQKALDAKRLTFVTSQSRVKVEFSCNTIKKIQFEGRDAFLVNFPKSLVRMQRRNFFRISTPTTKPLKCIVPLPAADDSDTAEVTLLDISCGGIAVIDHHPIISFDPGTIFRNCQITLPDVGTITATLQVKNTFEVTLRNGLSCKRAGCEFITLPAKMLAMIQRYIMKLEQVKKMD